RPRAAPPRSARLPEWRRAPVPGCRPRPPGRRSASCVERSCSCGLRVPPSRPLGAGAGLYPAREVQAPRQPPLPAATDPGAHQPHVRGSRPPDRVGSVLLPHFSRRLNRVCTLGAATRLSRHDLDRRTPVSQDRPVPAPTALRRLGRRLFGGPLLRLPAAPTAEARRVRW